MLASSIPGRFNIPFANSAGAGYIRPIPQASQIGIQNGAASLTDGFPPLNFLAVNAGGVPFFGADVNGIINEITTVQQWQMAGGFWTFNSAFSTAIGGYPAGSILISSGDNGLWLSTADNNTTDPDGGSPANWVPLGNSGTTTISGLTNANVTLTSTQYKQKVIFLTGTLTGNINIVFPLIPGAQWLIVNFATGAFTITAKTPSGSGIAIISGSNQIYCDNANIQSASQSATFGGNALIYSLGGTANAITGLVNGLTAYAVGQSFRFVAAGINTGPTTLNINSIGTGSIGKMSPGGIIALQGNEIITGNIYEVIVAGSGAFLLMNSGPYSQGGSVASAGTINLSALNGDYCHVTGTTTITAITLAQGQERTVVFDGPLTLTNGAALILPGAANIVTSAGDTAIFRGDGAGGNVVCVAYQRASLPPRGMFTSAQQTITASGSLTLAHGLSSIPDPGQITAYLVCTSNDQGYTAGQAVPQRLGQISSTLVDDYGCMVVPDATNLNIIFGSSSPCFTLLNFSTKSHVSPDITKWKIVFEARG